MDKEYGDREGQKRDDPEATGKSAGVRLHLVNKNTNTHMHTSVRTTLILPTTRKKSFHLCRRKSAPCKDSITFRSDDVTLMSGLGQHRPK